MCSLASVFHLPLYIWQMILIKLARGHSLRSGYNSVRVLEPDCNINKKNNNSNELQVNMN